MNQAAFPLDAYLQRVGLQALPDVTVDGLHALVRAQSSSIAFENLDVLADVQVHLEPAAILGKIVARGRGGYCYELNGLMALALQAAGFEVRTLLSRVTYRRPEPGPLSHQVLHVMCEGEGWLVDVGFGGPGLTAPVRMDNRMAFEQDGARFRLVAEQDGDLNLQRELGGIWCGLYLISPGRTCSADLDMANHFVSTYPHSPFRNRFMCVMPCGGNSWLIDGSDLVQLDAQHAIVHRQPLRDHRDLLQAMRSTFRIQLAEDIAMRAWIRVMNKPAETAGVSGRQ